MHATQDSSSLWTAGAQATDYDTEWLLGAGKATAHISYVQSYPKQLRCVPFRLQFVFYCKEQLL